MRPCISDFPANRLHSSEAKPKTEYNLNYTFPQFLPPCSAVYCLSSALQPFYFHLFITIPHSGKISAITRRVCIGSLVILWTLYADLGIQNNIVVTEPSSEQVPKQDRSGASISLAIASNMSSQLTTGLQFVVSTGVEKPDPELRKFIRSHVMLGKNQGRKLPPRTRKAKKMQELSSSSDPSPPLTSELDEDHLSSSAPFAGPSHPLAIVQATIPRKLGSGMSTIRFADALEPGTIEVVLQCE